MAYKITHLKSRNSSFNYGNETVPEINTFIEYDDGRIYKAMDRFHRKQLQFRIKAACNLSMPHRFKFTNEQYVQGELVDSPKDMMQWVLVEKTAYDLGEFWEEVRLLRNKAELEELAEEARKLIEKTRKNRSYLPSH